MAKSRLSVAPGSMLTHNQPTNGRRDVPSALDDVLASVASDAPVLTAAVIAAYLPLTRQAVNDRLK